MTTTPTTTPTSDAVDLPENIRGILARCRDFIDTTKVPAYPAGADLADEIDALLAAQGFRDEAVPQRWKAVPVNPTPEMWKAAKTVPDPNPPYPPHYGLVWDAMLAASPTPPAEQQAAKETSGGFHVWRDISTAPKDGSRFVATGHNYGLYSEVRHTCVAQWFRGCWMEASDWNETSELKYLTHWMPLPSPPDDVAAPAEQQAAQVIIDFSQVGTAGPFPVVNGRVSLPDATHTALPMHAAFPLMHPPLQQAQPGAVYAELPAPTASIGTDDAWHEAAMRDFADRTHAARLRCKSEQARLATLWGYVRADAAPKAAPAPLSEREAFERDWEKRHAPVPTNGRTHDDGRYGDSSIQDAWESWQARADLAAQGGNK